MRISDWSSDVCSSDLQRGRAIGAPRLGERLIERPLHLLAVGEPGQLVEARHSCDLGVRAALLGQVAARTDEAHEAAAIVGDGTARDRPPASGVVGAFGAVPDPADRGDRIIAERGARIAMKAQRAFGVGVAAVNPEPPFYHYPDWPAAN